MGALLHVLVNPAARRGRGERTGAAVVAELERLGCEVTVVRGHDGENASLLAQEAVDDGASTLVAVGGDGLVHTALQAVAGTGVTLGIVPAGTGNDIARSLAIPEGMAAACAVVAAGRTRRIDLGRAGDRWFAGILAAGFDSAVNARANGMTRPRGSARYPLAVLAELRSLRPLPFTVEVDGADVSAPYVFVAVGNGPAYGGGMAMCPAACLDDGLLDLTLAGPVSRLRLVRLLVSVYSGRHVRHPAVTTLQARRLRIDAPGVVAYADGELVGPLPLDIELVRGALDVLTPGGV